MTAEVREMIRRVRDEVLTGPEKWYGRARPVHAGALCLGYAIGRVTDGTDTFEPTYEALGFRSVFDIVAWNDAPERAFADIQALLDKALAEPVEGEPS